MFIFVTILILSCKTNNSKYESNWIVKNYKVDGTNSMDDIGLLNFLIDTKGMIVVPPSLFSHRVSRMTSHNIKFFKEEGIEIMEILDHPIFKGKYKLECLDSKCCTLRMSNERFYFELLYNGDVPFGWSRDCPKHY